jgi:outer membrane protein
LAHGLATPDVLEARSATAQTEYDLQAILGVEEIARGDLATAVGASATTVIHVQSLDQIPSRESIGDTVDQAIGRALEQRPDLMQQVAEIRSENARVQEARAHQSAHRNTVESNMRRNQQQQNQKTLIKEKTLTSVTCS